MLRGDLTSDTETCYTLWYGGEKGTMIPLGFVDVSALSRGVVYLLCWKGEVVYVGQSVKGYARIATHYSAKARKIQKLGKKVIKGVVFDQVLVQAVALSDLDRIETELIEKFLPIYNVLKKPQVLIPLSEIMSSIPVEMMPPPVAMPRIHRRF